MTARELIKYLECCDLDKEVVVVLSMNERDDGKLDVMLREVIEINEHEMMITIK